MPFAAGVTAGVLASRVFAALGLGGESELLHRTLPGPLAVLVAGAAASPVLAGVAAGLAPPAIWLALSTWARRGATAAAAGARSALGWCWLVSVVASTLAFVVPLPSAAMKMAALGYTIAWPALIGWAVALVIRGASPLGFAGGVTALFWLGLVIRTLPVGWPGETSMRWQRLALGQPWPWLVGGAIAVAGACLLPLLIAPARSRSARRLATAVLMLVPFLLQRGLACFEPWGAEKLQAALASPRYTSFLQASARPEPTPELLRRYVALLPELRGRVVTHPPGWTLVFRGAVQLGGSAAGRQVARLTAWAVGADPGRAAAMASQGAGRPLAERELNGLWLVAALALAGVMTFPPVVFWFVRGFDSWGAALRIASLSAFLGPLFLFLPNVDSVYPSLFVLAAAAWLRSERPRGAAWALLAGAGAALLGFLSFGNLALPFVLGIASLLSWRRRATTRRGEAVRLAFLVLPPLALMVAGVLAGYDYPRNLGLALHYHHVMMAGRTRALWALLNPLDLIATLGLPLVLWLGRVTPWQTVATAAAARRLDPALSIGVATALTLLVLDVAGDSKGETSRLWVGFYALLLAGFSAPWRDLRVRPWSVLAALAGGTLIVLKGFYVFGWTSTDLTP
jgi:hypothetical protein